MIESASVRLREQPFYCIQNLHILFGYFKVQLQVLRNPHWVHRFRQRQGSAADTIFYAQLRQTHSQFFRNRGNLPVFQNFSGGKGGVCLNQYPVLSAIFPNRFLRVSYKKPYLVYGRRNACRFNQRGNLFPAEVRNAYRAQYSIFFQVCKRFPSLNIPLGAVRSHRRPGPGRMDKI